ncbi:hypothetical protein C0991_000536 [Blastosporella zonata]|nr:hypothetical protein C0991_000536 [Blastosporella zonata]
MPQGKGRYHTIRLYLDMFSQHLWGFKYRSAGTGRTTTSALGHIFQGFAPSETFMTNGGKHFDCEEVRKFCTKWGTKTHVVAAYSPWVNGLVKGANKLLLHILKRLCSPKLGEDKYDAMNAKDLPRSWPNHLDKAICLLNWRLLPALDYSPKELLLGLVVNTPKTNIAKASSVLRMEDVDLQMAYAGQQRLDGYAAAVKHAMRWKATFDKRVLAQSKHEVVFKPGDLVQIYRNNLDYTFKTDRKLLPKWSTPRKVVNRDVNSYTLATLDNSLIPGSFSARRLQRFWPKAGTKLAVDQALVEARESALIAPKQIEDAERVRQERFEVEHNSEAKWEDIDEGKILQQQMVLGGADAATAEGSTWSIGNTPGLGLTTEH